MPPISPVLRIRYAGLLCLSLLAAMPLAAQQEDWYRQQTTLVYQGTGFDRRPAVAISGDGNTAFVSTTCVTGCDTGTVRIFTRADGAWSEEVPLDIGTLPGGQLGWSLRTSTDGNTLIIGAQADYQAGSPVPGAAVIWSRVNGAWVQQARLSGGNTAVAISGDGNTVAVGGAARFAPAVVNETGVWIYVRNGATWTRQAKLTDVAGGAALSADGNTALAGPAVYTRSGSTWTLQSALTYGGDAVALSADGTRALIGKAIYLLVDGVWTLNTTLIEEEGLALSADGRICFIRNAERYLAIQVETWGSWLLSWYSQSGGVDVALAADGRTALISDPYSVSVVARGYHVRLNLTATLSGNRVTLTVNVISPNPTATGRPRGPIAFTQNGTFLPASIARLDAYSKASYTITLTGQGQYEFGVVYSSENMLLFGEQSSPRAAQVYYGGPPAESTLGFEILPAAPTIGQTITFLATVNGANSNKAPTGTVNFYDGGNLLGAGSVINGQARFLTTLPKGPHSISAVYSGDASYPAASAQAVGLNVSRLPLTLSLRSSAAATGSGQPVTLAAAFATAQAPKGIAPPSGKVQFYAGNAGLFGMLTDRTLLGEAAIVDGVAALTTTALPAGQRLVVAVYLGDDNWSNGSSNTLTQVVTAP